MRDLNDVERESELLARHDAVCPQCQKPPQNTAAVPVPDAGERRA